MQLASSGLWDVHLSCVSVTQYYKYKSDSSKLIIMQHMQAIGIIIANVLLSDWRSAVYEFMSSLS